ncbi:MAG: SLC13 family permease [Chloroflexi bacterium]|nr:SLC13 family permease [Chloroflexota bacterium]
MTPQIAIVFVILLIATTLLITEKLRSDVIALLTLSALGLTGLVGPQDVFAGFSRPAVITILSIFIITAGLERTGATRAIGNRLLRLAGASEARLIPLIMVAGAAFSLVMNNIAAGAVLLPAVVGITRQTDLKPSKLLMPLSFATMLGGMATLLTTSNILVSNALREANLKAFSLFDFAPVGIPIVIVGILYMLLVGRRLLPERNPGGSGRATTPRELAEVYGLKQGVSQVYVCAGSSMAGNPVKETGWSEKLGLTVIGVSRGGHVTLSPGKSFVILEGDVVLAGGQTDDTDLAYYGLIRTDDPTWKGDLASDDVDLVELILSPRSEFINKTLKEINFRGKYGLSVLSIWRKGAAIRDALGDIPLQWGDALLAQGPHHKIKIVRADPNMLVLDEDDAPLVQPRKAPLAVLIVTAALALATFEILPIAEAAFAAALALVLAGCLTMDEAYRSIEWRSIFLIAGFIPLGIALEHSGAAALIGQALAAMLGRFGPVVMAGGLFLATTLILQVVGNVGSAVIFAPIAITAAQQMGSDPRAFAMAVALGTSMAFLTPTAHPVNVMMMGPGGYTVRDFIKVGWGLTAALFIVVVVVLPIVWRL